MTEEVQTTADALTLAEAKHAELQARLERAEEQAEANRKKAHALAFDAEGKDDVEAKRLSTKLLADADRLDDDIAHRLQPAVAEARRRVEAARKAVAKAALATKIERTLERVQPLAELGKVMDECFAQIVETKMNAFEIIGEINNLGVGSPSIANVEVLVDAHIGDLLRRSGLFAHAKLLPPLERSSLESLFSGWQQMTENWCAAAKSDPAAAEKHGRAA